MNIPSYILEAISKGECTLFLGAGASNPTGAPSGEELSELITNRFLGGGLAQGWGLNLASAASLACAQPSMDRGSIEHFVCESLSASNPSPAHLKIPWFRWRAIITTNYDCLIERSYEIEARAVQKLVPVLKEKALPDLGARGSEMVPLLKPHGCISEPNSISLSLEDIYQAKKERHLLFTYIEVLHLLGPVIYIGYSLKDIHVLDMIYDLTARLGRYRKPILFVTLQSDSERADKERNWIQGPLRGIYSADGFEELMNALSKQITPAIVPAMVFRQMAPCRTITFASDGLASATAILGAGGEWEYSLTYSINHQDGYAGLIFERIDGTVDISRFRELNPQGSSPGSAGEAVEV
jgi:SIR2-like domain